MEIKRLDGTRTSHSWASLPGNFDKLNTFAVYPSSNQWGIPDLPHGDFIPDSLVAYNSVRGISAYKPVSDMAAVHFFLDDYRFETMWSKPQRGLERVKRVGASLTPDFSLWRDMPQAVQIFQVYRARWCGMWMWQHGVHVIPTISWSTPDSYNFAFAGVAQGSVVAVSTVGIKGADVSLFRQGLDTMIQRIEPSAVLVYGRSLGEDIAYDGDVDFRYFKTRWEQ